MNEMWTAEKLLEVSQGFEKCCVVMAAAELDMFNVLLGRPMSAAELSERLQSDTRATRVLADALAAVKLVHKDQEGRYHLDSGAVRHLTERCEHSVLSMIRHRARCMRAWVRLPWVVRSGEPAEALPSIRGEEADLEAFIEAMADVNRPAAPGLLSKIGPPGFKCLLDLGGGPGTWTIEFLRLAPGSKAVLYDRPQVIPIAAAHVRAAGLRERVQFVCGDYLEDEELPGGCDLAWVSSICHQNSPEQNRLLFEKLYSALPVGGRVLVRDAIMEPSRVEPERGALFAVNMLVNTEGGSTYTFDELKEALTGAGFDAPAWLNRGSHMDSVLEALKSK